MENKLKKLREWEEVKKEILANTKVKKEYEALAPQYKVINAVLKLRLKNGLSQEALAKKIKTKQSNISRLESGRTLHSLSLLARVAQALGRELEITFRQPIACR